MQIEFEHISHTFPGRPPRVALQEVNLRVPGGQFCAVLGPSGCGKSTLLRLAAGLLQPSAGQILVDDRPPEAAARQRNIAWLSQSPALLPWLTARANAALASRFLPEGRAGQLSPQEALARVGLGDAMEAYPYQLSGGMQQRLALARLLCLGARVWLMDEPFAALDILTRERLAGELITLWQPLRPTVVWVTHHVGEALRLADRVVVLSAPGGRSQNGSGQGQVLLDLAIDLPRPRREADPAFQAAAQQLREALGVFLEPAVGSSAPAEVSA
jgi:NitT/TauT family transport system ATP-binding protein